MSERGVTASIEGGGKRRRDKSLSVGDLPAPLALLGVNVPTEAAMGLLDQVLGGVLGGGGQSSPIAGVLMNMLQGNQGAAQGNVSGLGGGIGGLLQQFERAGLGQVAQSWVGNGPNQPVSPHQLRDVFGEQRVQEMAGQAGMEPNDFLGQLSQHLPRAVDAATPNGTVQNEGTMSV